MKRRFFCFGSLAALLPLGILRRKNHLESSTTCSTGNGTSLRSTPSDDEIISVIKWISVKDRLPNPCKVRDDYAHPCKKTDGYHLVSNRVLVKYSEIGIAQREVSRGSSYSYWVKIDGNCTSMCWDRPHPITHWAELPDWEREV